MPGRRWRRFSRDDSEPLLIGDGDAYTEDELRAGRVRLAEVPPDPDPPPEETRGEPWGWTKGPPYPRGWRQDGLYGPQSRGDPGPYDGAWEPPGGGS